MKASEKLACLMNQKNAKETTQLSYPSLLISFFKTNRNPTEYDPGAFKSMNAWLPALSTAFQHSIQNFNFSVFTIRQSGNTWPQHTVIFTTVLLPFSLLCKSMRVS